ISPNSFLAKTNSRLAQQRSPIDSLHSEWLYSLLLADPRRVDYQSLHLLRAHSDCHSSTRGSVHSIDLQSTVSSSFWPGIISPLWFSIENSSEEWRRAFVVPIETGKIGDEKRKEYEKRGEEGREEELTDLSLSPP
ncbi:hypothetical protein PFISCL1PPCAC_6127, partial [Pristionchus fissidentatus]